MKRAVIKRLASALYRPDSSLLWKAHCRLRLPSRLAATAPLWSPSDNHLEALTARVWAVPATHGATAQAAVVTSSLEANGAVLAEAEVATEHVIGLGGLCDKPHRIRWMARTGTLRITSLAGDHPASRYQAWCDRVTEQIEETLDALWCNRGLSGGLIDLSRLPGGGFHATVGLWVDSHPNWRRAELAGHATALTAVARTLGTGTWIRFSGSDDTVLDPLYYQTRRRLLNASTTNGRDVHDSA